MTVEFTVKLTNRQAQVLAIICENLLSEIPALVHDGLNDQQFTRFVDAKNVLTLLSLRCIEAEREREDRKRSK